MKQPDLNQLFLDTANNEAVNWGQQETHGTYTDFNVKPKSWGWSYVLGATNAPHNTSSQWYRCRVSLGKDYQGGIQGGGGAEYWLELAYPRYGTVQEQWMRTCENEAIGAWRQIGGARFSYTTGNVVGGWPKNIGNFTSNGRPCLVHAHITQFSNATGGVRSPVLRIGSATGTTVMNVQPYFYNEALSHKSHSSSTIFTFPAGATSLWVATGDVSDGNDTACVTILEV